MSNTRWLLAAILSTILAGGTVHAAETGAADDSSETRQDLLLDTIRANRKALVAVNLGLGAEESGRFWPIYERYRQEIDAIGNRMAELIRDYTASFRDLSDEKALKLTETTLALEAERLQVRRMYLPEFASAVGGRKAARFYQIENKMDAVLRYDLAASIPVVDEPDAAPAK